MTWQPGQSGNPRGRPPGARQALTEAVYKDIVSHWAEFGMEAIERLYKERPDLYVSAVVRLIPVQHQLEVADHRSAIEYSTQELLGMVNGEVIEHQPTKRITRQTEVASASVAEDTGPVDGDGS